MCDIENCKKDPCGLKKTEFDNNKLYSELCDDHFKSFYKHEDNTHKHTWINYVSMASCLCMIGMCSPGLV